MLRQTRYVPAIDEDLSFIGKVGAGNQIEKCGFACTIGPDYGDKLPFFHFESNPVDRHLLVDRMAIEYLSQVLDDHHLFQIKFPGDEFFLLFLS